jgi:hypothetical protein
MIFFLNSACSVLPSFGGGVVLVATGVPTATKNSSCPAGEQRALTSRIKRPTITFSLRQSYDRYAIRAGRNLPDQEFRYLRTVIATAAVHRGFSSKLSLCS